MDGTVTAGEFFKEVNRQMRDGETDTINVTLHIGDVKATYKIELIEVEEVNV